MGKFGKNDWKIRMYKAVSGAVVVGVVTAAAVIGIPKLQQRMDTGDTKTSSTQVSTAKQDTSEKEASEIEKTKTPAVTNTPIPEPTKASLLESAPDLEAYYHVPVVTANASSTIVQQGTSNDPMLLFDGRDDTNWQEGVAGYGINEYIAFSFDTAAKLKYIGFKLGNWKNDKYYFGNAMPKTMTLTIGDYSGQVTFKGIRETEWIEVSPFVKSDSMRITIDDVYPGTTWEDTCITEIMVYAEQ